MSDQRQAEDAQTALDAVVAASRAGAQQVEEGRFRLDWQKALDKIKRFQLADPHRYVLELVPAAIASGASAIGVTTDADDVHFSFDGQPYSEEELTRLFDYLFAQDVSLVRVRQLALAVNSALGLQPKWVIVESGDGTVGHRMRLSTYKDHRVESLAGEEVPRGTRVHVRERVSWKVMGDLFRTENAEDRLLADSCLHSPVPLVLNGSDVRRPVEGLSRARRTFQHGEIRGEVLLPVDIIAGSSLDVCMGGVSIVTVTDVDGELVGPVAVRGWVDSTALSRNASHSDVHRDAHFHDCFSAVRLAVREMIGEWVDAVLLGDSEGRGQALAERKFSGTEVHYLGSAARLLLRGAGPGLLPPGLEALLDVPGLVDLAVSKPSGSSLRPLWESYRRSNRWHVASKRYDVKLGDLPPDLFPVLGPVPVLESIFPQGRQSADEPLAEIERGLYNRRQREKWRQQPRVSSADVVVARPVADEKRGIRGEIGLLRLESGPCLGTLAWMVTFGKLGAHLAPRERGVHVVFLRDGVYLGERMISAPVRHAIAVLDSPGFAASVDWDDLSPNEVFEAVEGLLAAAVPGLLEELANTVHELPPPSHLAKIGEWRPETGVVEGVPLELGAGWARDRLAGEIRWHVDAILAEHEKFDREAAPWLWAWPIFFTLDGRAVSLSELESVDGRIRYVVEQPWGRGTPRGAFVLNVSAQQQKFLRRYVPNALGAKKALLSYRKTATAEAAIRKRRELNLAVAETKRQEPRLEPLSYAAVLDLDLEEGSGQVGIPVALAGPSWVRYLFDSLPLPEEEIDTPVPVHVVVSTPLARADEAFGKQIEAEGRQRSCALCAIRWPRSWRDLRPRRTRRGPTAGHWSGPISDP